MTEQQNGGRKRRGDGPAGAPQGPRGPRRPAAPSVAGQAPGRGANRPAPSLVTNTNESTPQPDLKYRTDDIGRGFLYAPIVHAETPVPPINDGIRATTALSPRGVRQIKGAAMKAESMGLPLRTFMTFTVRPEDRKALENGEFILGREMRRVINALNEWFRRRGMPLLVFIWVAENPNNENPHVHMLTNHVVPRAEFDAFAAHVESLWGHGWVRIERVRRGESAGRYLLKAVRYTLKGNKGQSNMWGDEEDDTGQGRIIGNRYGIARAILPKYETIELYDCADAAYGLRDMQKLLGDSCEEYAPGIWLTPYGLAFEKDTDLDKVREVIDHLNRCRDD